MRYGELRRAVEDVILRPEERTPADDKRGTLAALDLCQSDPTAPVPPPSAAAMNTVSCSQEAVPGASTDRPPPPLCTSTSLDTIVYRQSHSLRPSATATRRSSRVLSHLSSKRKRSNSVSSCYKGLAQPHSLSLPPSARQTPFRESVHHSLASSDSVSSAPSEEVREEDETDIELRRILAAADSPPHSQELTHGANPFTAYRERIEREFDEEAMDCD